MDVPIPIPLLAAVLGALFGSFLGVLATRVPAGEGVIRGRSRCDACGSTLSATELIPVISWLALRGRCRTCGARVSALWSVLELSTAGVFVLASRVASDAWTAGLLAPFLGILLALTLIDVRTLRLPDAVVGPSFAGAAAVIGLSELFGGDLRLTSSLLGAAAFAGALGAVYVVAGKVYGAEAMGFGDVKLAGLIGLVVGAIDLGSVAVAAGAAILLGGVVGLVALASGAGRRARVPFGPMLCAGAFIAVVAGPSILDAYLGLYR